MRKITPNQQLIVYVDNNIAVEASSRPDVYCIYDTNSLTRLAYSYGPKNWPTYIRQVKRRRVKQLERQIANYEGTIKNRKAELVCWSQLI